MICIYEDEGYQDLSVLVDLRPAFDLRCGRRTLFEKLRALYPHERVVLWVRDELAGVAGEAHPDCGVNSEVEEACLFLNGRVLLDHKVPVRGPDRLLLCGERIVGFRLKQGQGPEADLAEQQVKARFVEYPWHLVDFTPGELARELRGGAVRGRLDRGAVVVGPKARLRVSAKARVWPGAVVSLEQGPVVVDRGAQVRPGSFVEGPCWIGPGTVIDGARVRPGCSFGPDCRVGGEVEASVFHGHTNKHHDGFIGHAYVGEWVNLGALTTNSDLKNAYQPVQVTLGRKPVDTGLLKVGCFIGDHAKTAIGSLLNTGAVVGTFANWFEPGLSPKVVPRFSWGAKRSWVLRDALAAARSVMARRGVVMSSAYESLLKKLHRRHTRR